MRKFKEIFSWNLMPAASFLKKLGQRHVYHRVASAGGEAGSRCCPVNRKGFRKTANVWNHGVNNAAVYKSLKQTHVEDWTLFAKWTLRWWIINQDGCWSLMFSLLLLEKSEKIPAGFQFVSPKDSVRKQTEPDLERSSWAKRNVTNLLHIPAFNAFMIIKHSETLIISNSELIPAD